MCVLCGDLAGDLHWAERAAGTAGVDAETERRQARFRRTLVVNRVLAPYLLSVHEDLSATRYVVADRKGAQEVVRDLGELWPAADRLARTTLDPLDSRLIGFLEDDHRA
jgi:hypothetical protein